MRMKQNIANNKDITEFNQLRFIEIEGWAGEGIRAVVEFQNGYGASIVRHSFSYGGKDGLYELAVLDYTGSICYSTPITSDVLGHLSEQDVSDALKSISELDPIASSGATN